MDGRQNTPVVSRRALLRAAGVVSMVSLLGACAPTAPPPPSKPATQAAAPAPAATAAPVAKAVAPVKIGAVLPLSGVLAETGASMKAATDLGAETVNSQGGVKALGGAKLELVYGDSQGKPDIGISETERLIQQGQVVAITGAWNSSVTLPTTQAAERLKTPYINPVSGADQIPNRGFKYTFMTCTVQREHGRDMVDYLQYFAEVTGKKISRIAFLHEDTDYGQNTIAGGKEFSKKKGWEEVVDVAYSASSPDLTAEVARVKAANPDVILQGSYLNDAILIARAADKLGVTQQFVDGGGAVDLKFVKNLGQLGEGWAMLNQWNKDLTIPGTKELNDRFKAKTGFDLDGNAAEFYQSIFVLKLALEKAGKADREALREALATIDIQPGPDLVVPYDRIKFDERGFNTFARDIITEIHGGQHITVFPAKFAAAKPVARKSG